MKNLRSAAVLILIGLFANFELSAQTTRTSITGTITDEQKKPIPGVRSLNFIKVTAWKFQAIYSM